jgi:hypothetical protein
MAFPKRVWSPAGGASRLFAFRPIALFCPLGFNIVHIGYTSCGKFEPPLSCITCKGESNGSEGSLLFFSSLLRAFIFHRIVNFAVIHVFVPIIKHRGQKIRHFQTLHKFFLPFDRDPHFIFLFRCAFLIC